MNRLIAMPMKSKIVASHQSFLAFAFCILQFAICNSVFGQIINKAFIKNDTGIYIVCPLDFRNDTNGNVQNDGNIYVGGNFINNSVFNSGSISNVKLDGVAQDIGGTSPPAFNNLIIDGTDNKTFSVNSSVADSLVFNANKILIANNNLYLLPSAVIFNANNLRFIVTNGTGNVVKKSLPLSADFLFPVGDTLSSYKPVILNYTGTIDTFAVRVEKNIIPITGADQTCVQNTWVIEESNTGGTTASLNLGWNTLDEGTLFIDTIALIWQNISGTWASIAGTPGATANLPATDWYYQTTGITDFSSVANRFIVRTFSPPVITIQPANQTACAGGTLSFNLTATGQGTLIYQWQENCGTGWSNLADNATYSGVNTDSLVITSITTGCAYQCIVSNPAGSVTSDSVIATVNPLPTPAITGTLSYCAGDSTTLQTGQFSSYQWSTGSVNQSAFVTIADNPVTVTVTDTSGCIGISAGANVTENLLPTPAITGTLSYCAGDSTTLQTGQFSSYQWSTGSTNQSTSVTIADNPVTVTVTDTSGCTGISTGANVTENLLPTPAITGTLSYCAGDSTTLQTTQFSNYQWSTGSTSQSTYVTIADNPVTVTVTDTSGCIGFSADANVMENTLPTPAITGMLSYCAGDSTTLQTGSFSSYLWSTGTMNQSTSVTIADNPVTVTVTDTSGCIGFSADANVTENLLPTPAITGTLSYCASDSTTLQTGQFSSYQWSTGTMNQSTSVTIADNPVTVTVTDTSGCTGISTGANVTENPLPAPAITGTLSYCAGDSTALQTGQFSTYQWTTGSMNQSTSVTIADNPVTVTVTDTNGCAGVSASATVVENSVSITPSGVSASQDTICSGASISLSVNGGLLGLGASYVWYSGSCGTSQIGTGSSVSVSPTSTMVYFVRAEGSCNTTACANTTITVNSNLSVSISIAANDTVICSGANVVFTATGTNGGTTPGYQWYLNGIPAGTNSTTYTNSNLSNSDAVSCTLTSSETCAAGNPATSGTIVMQVSTSLTPSVTVTSNPVLPVCSGTSVTFTATVVNGGTSPQIQWFVNTVFQGSGSNFSPSYISGNEQIYCTLNSNLTCLSINNVHSNTLSVTLNPLPVLAATIQSESCAGAGDASINLNITQGTPPYTSHWDNLSDASPDINNLQAGTYSVTVTDSKSCEADTTIYISSAGGGCLFIPNVFSPNGDGKNDLLFVRGSSIKSLSLKIYDRWGNRVFEANNQNDGWDGTYNGETLNAGVFVYYMKAELENGKTVDEQGNITLLK